MFIVLFSEYDNDKQVGENFMDCTNGRSILQYNKVCRFNIDWFGDDCTWKEDYGYDEGNPCVLVKLNTVSALFYLLAF